MRSLILIAILSVIFTNAQNNTDRHYTMFTDSIGNFQLKILANTAAEIGPHLVIAPFSIWTLMALLAEGALGETNKQIRMAIGKIVSRQFSHSGFANLTKFFDQEGSVKVERKSFLFHDLNIVIDSAYVRNVTAVYGTNVVPIDTSQPQVAATTVNEYLSKATYGRIEDVVDPQEFTNARVILTETVYFKGSWMKSFNVSATKKENFFDEAGHMIGKVNMMYQRMSLGFTNIEELGGHVIELPYGHTDQFAMLVMLPYQGVRVLDMYESLQNVTFIEIFNRLMQDQLKYSTDDVDVWLPRFKITTDVHLVKPLKTIGIERIFMKNANFSRMTHDAMYVTDVIHKAEIEVTEEGTVAAAVGGALFSHRTTVPKFRADRPFIFIILEKLSNTILFSGIYSQPSLFGRVMAK